MTTEHDNPETPNAVPMPAPTAWPFVLASGATLTAAGLVTNPAVTVVGAILVLVSAIGWARLVFMPGGFEQAPRVPAPQPIRPAPAGVETMREGMPGHRLRVPEKIHPYTAGAKGGLVGAFTMTVPALIYALATKHGIWYPLNLLAGMVVSLPRLPDQSLDIQALQQFHWGWMIVGVVIHGTISVSLGLMYGVILPMLPNRPIIWGGLVAPLLWTGAIHGFMGVLNPALREVVDWPSFIASQFIFGLTVGVVVVRSEQVYVGSGIGTSL